MPATKSSNPNDDRKLQKQVKAIERKIAKLDDERKDLNQQLLTETDPTKALDIHNQVEAIVKDLQEAEETWLELN